MINWEDTLLAHHAWGSHLPKRLDFVVPLYTDAFAWKLVFNRRGQEEKGSIAAEKLSEEDFYFYNGMDCIYTKLAWDGMQPRLRQEEAVYEHDKRLAELCSRMTRVGIGFDAARRKELSATLTASAAESLSDMRAMVGPDFNPQVPSHLRKALFVQLGAPILTKTKTYLAATDKGVLAALAATDTEAGKLAKLVGEWRYAEKLRATFVDGIKPGADGRVHANWKSFGTISSRLACRNPNLMNQPHARKGFDPRCLYIPRPGYRFNYFDVKTAEMKFAAYLSGDTKSIAEVESSDCYVAAAISLFSKVPGAVEALTTDPKGRGKRFRQMAKICRLAANYLIVADSLWPKVKAAGINVPLKDVERVLDKIHYDYRSYFLFVQSNVAVCERQGWIADPILGRKRRLGFHPGGPDVANYPIQAGIGAVMAKRMLTLDTALQERYDGEAKIVCQVHDSVITETPEALCDEVAELYEEIWAEPIVLANGNKFVLTIDNKVGDSLGDFE